MIFGAAAFLLATAAAVIPLVLHMINRQRAKELPFSTLRFLKISVQKTRRRRRIHDLLLMLLRMAVLILIAVGLAQPTVSKLRSLLGSTNSAVAIILDNSASMACEDQGRKRFDTAVAAANQILDELADGDQVALWVTSGVQYPELETLDRSQSKVRQLLSQVAQGSATYEGGNLAAALDEARQRLAQSEAVNKQIFVITDNQATAWQGLIEDSQAGASGGTQASSDSQDEGEKPGLDIPVIIVDCHRAPKPNVAIRRVKVQTTIPVAGVPMKAAIELQNASSTPQARLAELYLNGEKYAATSEVEIPPESSTTTEIVFAVDRGGLHRGEVRLVGEDGSPHDDRYYFTVEVDPTIPVAVVTTQRHQIPYLDESFYLERALKPVNREDWAIRATVLTADELATEPLTNYRVVFLVNLPVPETAVAARLRSYVEEGGNLFWIAGDEVDPLIYNEMNEEAGGQLLPGELKAVRMPQPQDDRDSWFVASLNEEHPAMAYLADPPSLYQSVLVYKYIPCDVSQTPASTSLARLDGDGDPLLVQRSVKQGSVTWLATSAHVGWTNLPLRPIFVPLIARLTFDLAGVAPAQHQAIAGQPLVLQFEGRMAPSAIEVVPPSGATIRPEVNSEDGTRPKEFRYDDTHSVGVYTFRLLEAARPVQIAYAVNVDPDEADPEKLSRDDLEERLGGAPVVFAEDPENLASTFELLRRGRSLSEVFLAAVLFALVFETFVSNWFSPKEKDQPPHYIPGRPRGRTAAPVVG